MIPKLLHRFWIGEPMPEEFVGYGQKWQELHPEWIVRDWTPESLPILINEPLFQQATELVPAENVGQFCADIVRLELLYRFGGVWVDTDLEPLKPIDELLKGVSLFAGWEEQGKWIGNTILGSVKAHRFIGRALAGLSKSVGRNLGKTPNIVTGPQYLTKLYWEERPEMKVFDQGLFYPFSYRELDRAREEFPDAYCKHHWFHKRKARGA